MCFLERGWSRVFCDFQFYHKSHLPFLEILQVVQNIWRFSSSVLTTLIDFSCLRHFRFTKKLMTSTCNKHHQWFFLFKLLQDMENFVMLLPTLKALQIFPRDALKKLNSEILIHTSINCTKALMLYITMKMAPVAEV